MCGIAGEARFDGSLADLSLLTESSQEMRKRGPDGEGLLSRGGWALAHRRLKIIDLSDLAAQPMVDSQLALSLVFNGCIYNYSTLRGELEGLGYRFFSQGDSEVILKAYDAWGPACVERFNGMFAFVIHELRSGRLFVARDRLGIKPLYYSHQEGKFFRFASRLQSLLKYPDTDRSLDPVALHHYLSFHAVVPPPRTLLQGVRKWPQAHRGFVEPDGKVRMECYWKPEFTTPEQLQDLSFSDWKHRVLNQLTKAVERRMVADVPVGVLLSGGLDSSLIVGLLAQSGCKDLNTFSIGFEAVRGEKGDEFEYSDVIAKEFSTRHHQLFVDSQKALDTLVEVVEAQSEPMVSHDNIGFYLLSKEVSRHVKVVQSGQGADEIFAGYHWYPPMMESQDALADYSKAFFDRDHNEVKQMLDGDWAAENYSLDFVREHFAQSGAPQPIDKALRIDSLVMLVDDPVKRVDNMTMAWGLEARVPFLDHELVELAGQIPAELKVREGGKYILKEVAREVIPASVIDRPKGYFPVPALKYIQGDYLNFVKDLLHSRAARQRALFKTDYVDGLLQAPEQHITPLQGSKLWQVALLEYWLQTHV